MHGRTTVLVGLPQARCAASAVADVAASHGALNGSVLLIEGVRTHVSAISTGALGVFRASSTPNPAPPRPFCRLEQGAQDHLPVQEIIQSSCNKNFGGRGLLPAGAWLNGLTRGCLRSRSLDRDQSDRSGRQFFLAPSQLYSTCTVQYQFATVLTLSVTKFCRHAQDPVLPVMLLCIPSI
jgi:hypothetical protein